MVLLTDRAWPDADVETALAAGAGYRLVELADVGVAIDVDAGDVHGVLTNWHRVDADFIGRYPNLRGITRLGVGVDNIDLVVASHRGIVVTRVPDYCVEEVADHAVGLALALLRGIAAYDRDVRAGGWTPGTRTLRRVRDLTIAIWGTGRTGVRTGEKFSGLGCRVLYDDRNPQRVPASSTALPVEQLLAACDVLSLHLPLTSTTRSILGAGALAQMRPGAVVLNVSRGGLIDLDALTAALAAGRLGGAGLDVFPDEPDVPGALRERDDVVLTPHVAFSSDASVAELRERATRDLLTVLAGGAPDNPVPLSG